MVHAGLPRQGAEKTRGVKPCAGAENSASRKLEPERQLARDDIAGVRDVDENAVKAGIFDLLRVAAHGGDRKVHFGQAVVRLAQQLNFADAVNNDGAFAEILIAARADCDAVRKIGDRVAQILHFAGKFLRVSVDQHQLVCNALYRQRVGDVRADVTETDDTENFFLIHKNASFRKQFKIGNLAPTCRTSGTARRYRAWQVPYTSPE